MRQLACILIALAIAGVYGDEPDKLVNGIPADIKDYPHCISIRFGNSYICGGSLISPTHVLTVAHCVVRLIIESSRRDNLTVVTGTTYLNSGGQAHKVANMWYHENYELDVSGRAPYDIGLLKLASPVQFSETQQPIKLPTKDVIKDESVTIAAWGSTGYKKDIHNNLQQLHAKAMLPDKCQSYHRFFMKIHENELCTLISRGTGLCNGDSGSALMRDSDKTIIGLVSGGRPCAEGYPDVYTNVYRYLAWIKEKMSY